MVVVVGGLVTKFCPTLVIPWIVAWQALSKNSPSKILEGLLFPVVDKPKVSGWAREAILDGRSTQWALLQTSVPWQVYTCPSSGSPTPTFQVSTKSQTIHAGFWGSWRSRLTGSIAVTIFGTRPEVGDPCPRWKDTKASLTTGSFPPSPRSDMITTLTSWARHQECKDGVTVSINKWCVRYTKSLSVGGWKDFQTARGLKQLKVTHSSTRMV